MDLAGTWLTAISVEAGGTIEYPDPVTRVMVTEGCPVCTDAPPRDPREDRFLTDPGVERRYLDG